MGVWVQEDGNREAKGWEYGNGRMGVERRKDDSIGTKGWEYSRGVGEDKTGWQRGGYKEG